MKRGRGRPHILDLLAPTKPGTKQRTHRELFLKAIADGNSIEGAAAAAGVTKQTIYNALKSGRRASSGWAREFVDAYDIASGLGQVVFVGDMKRNSRKGDTRATIFMLERRWPRQWGPALKSTVQHTGKVTFDGFTFDIPKKPVDPDDDD